MSLNNPEDVSGLFKRVFHAAIVSINTHLIILAWTFMQRLIFIIVVMLMALPAFSQSGYVCEPCGNSCDTIAYTASGSCDHCGMKLVPRSSITYKDISFEQICERLRKNPKTILLDVRSPAEFAGTSSEVPTFGHFKKAVNINITELESRVSELAKYKDREIIVYCSHSHRSPRGSYYLSTHGFKNIKNMAGGVSTVQDDEARQCFGEGYIKHAK